MSDLITSIDLKDQGPGIKIIHAQDVEPVTMEVARRRLTDAQQGKEGLGILKASIPLVEIEKAKHQGINLYDSKQRAAWLKNHPQYVAHMNCGRSGKIVIK